MAGRIINKNHEFSVAFLQHIEMILEETLINSEVSFLELELTGRCGNACHYCGVDATAPVDLNDKDVILFLKDWKREVLQSNQEPIVSLAGGDPLLYPEIKHLISALSQLQLSFMIKTNSHSINDSNLDLISNAEAVKMTIPDNYDDGRNKDNLQALLDATRLIHSRNVMVIWQATIHDGNMEAILKLLSEVDLDIPITLAINRVLPFSQKQINHYQVTSHTYYSFLNKLLILYSSMYKKNFTLRFKEKLWIHVLEENNLLPQKYLSCSSSGCDCFQPQLTIDRNGNVFPCSLIRKTNIGTIANTVKVLFHKRSELMLKSKMSCQMCQLFNICNGCMGASEAITGSRYNIDPHCLKHVL